MDEIDKHIVKDRSPTTKKLKPKDYVPAWGANHLDRDWEPFDDAEVAAANKIGTPEGDALVAARKRRLNPDKKRRQR